jgi:DNA polymerase elongation subunit (family B)
MITKKEFRETLFIDIETVPLLKDEEQTYNFNKKFKINDSESFQEVYESKASLYGEFSKIICISYGRIKYNYSDNTYQRFVKNIFSENENEVLEKFISICNIQVKNCGAIKFCGHNIEKFDIPFIIKRLIINNIKIPAYLDMTKYKPWDNKSFDTMRFWDLTSYSATSLELLYNVLFPENFLRSEKNILEFYSNSEFKKISKYCDDDVNMVMDIIIKMESLYDV